MVMNQMDGWGEKPLFREPCIETHQNQGKKVGPQEDIFENRFWPEMGVPRPQTQAETPVTDQSDSSVWSQWELMDGAE